MASESGLPLDRATIGRAVVENAIDAIVVIDDRGIVRDANPATERLLGWPPDELVGANVNVLMVEPERGAHDGYLARYLREGDPRIVGRGREVTARRKDGSTLLVFLSVAEIEIDGRRMFTGSLHDVNELREAEAEASRLALLNRQLDEERRRIEELTKRLERSNADLENFARVAAHDLAQPLRSVVSFSDLLAEHLDERFELDDEAREFLDEIAEGGRRMHASIDGVLELAQAEQSDLRAEPVSVREMFDRVRASLSVLVDELAADVAVDDTDLCVQGDPRHLQRVLQNLVENALKYRRPDAVPWVRMSAELERGIVAILVVDNGLGIPERYRETIFEPFSRLTTRDRVPGTGLGLAICRRIIVRHGGKISVDAHPDAGSVFRVDLPVAGPASNGPSGSSEGFDGA